MKLYRVVVQAQWDDAGWLTSAGPPTFYLDTDSMDGAVALTRAMLETLAPTKTFSVGIYSEQEGKYRSLDISPPPECSICRRRHGLELIHTCE